MMTDYRLEELSLAHEKNFLKSDHAAAESKIVPSVISDASSFRKFLKESEKQRLDWRPGPGKISITRYLMLDESDEVLAVGLLRFPLDEKADRDGGNLLCEVAHRMRGKGYGSYCLALLLFEAVRAGLRRVLLSCPATDGAARRVIEKNRGQLSEIVRSPDQSEIASYWISF